MATPLRVGIVGGTGYTGVELLRLLVQHPSIELAAITSRGDAGTRVDAMYPSLRGRTALAFTTPDEAPLTRCDVVFFATPHGVAMKQARQLVDAGVKVIDLAADFRIKDVAVFEKWYGMAHACPDLLAEAVYGLPEIHRDALRRARVVGMPGCYPTSVQLGLMPLLELERERPGTVDVGGIVADCKSGASGAGRKAEVSLLLSEAADNFKAYGVSGHRHHPEIVQQLDALAGRPVTLTFVPHLVPMVRGIFSTLYVRVTPAAGGLEALQARYERRYAGEPFVDVMPPGSLPETRFVRASNFARIALARGQGDLVIVMVVEDNLVKGAAGQAVQAMNVVCGLPETAGLMQVPVVP